MNLRDQILAAEDRKIVSVDVPEWGITVHVRTMSASERDRFEEVQIRQKWQDLRARLAVATLCTEEGELIFSEPDVAEVASKNGHALDRIFAVSSKLNHLTAEDVAELKKNSEEIRSSGSSSSLRSPSACPGNGCSESSIPRNSVSGSHTTVSTGSRT
jgi:hypothetical protein